MTSVSVYVLLQYITVTQFVDTGRMRHDPANI